MISKPIRANCLRFITASVLISFALPASADTPVRFDTNVGAFEATLFDDVAPAHVANFLNYVERGDYDGTIVHRSAQNNDGTPFVIQGGGFTPDLEPIPADPPVANEASLSNVRGTLAAARSNLDIDSATSQWYINLGDNSFLDLQQWTVFGQISSEGMAIVDSIAALPRASTGAGPFTELPVLGLPLIQPPEANLIIVQSVRIVPEAAMLPIVAIMATGLLTRCRRSLRP